MMIAKSTPETPTPQAATPAKPKIHPLERLSRTYHALCIKHSKVSGKTVSEIYEKYTGVITTIFIESCRRGYFVPDDAVLPLCDE